MKNIADNSLDRGQSLIVPCLDWHVDEPVRLEIHEERIWPIIPSRRHFQAGIRIRLSAWKLDCKTRVKPKSKERSRCMKMKYCLLGVITSLALSGCDRNQPAQDSAPPAVTAQDLKQDVKQTKDDFLAMTDKKMKELDAKMDDLAKKSADYKDDAKVQADKALASLRDQREAVRKKYDELKNSSQDAWDKTKDAFAAAWADLQKAYDDAKAKFQ